MYARPSLGLIYTLSEGMLKLKKRLISLLLMLLLAFCMVTASADEPPLPPTPWYRDLGNGLVFHYRPDESHYHANRFSRGTPAEFEAQGYPRTGLYRNGELIYTVEVALWRFIYWSSLYFSNDGMSFIEIPWVRTSVPMFGYAEPIRPAVRFFEQGHIVHYYEVFDLVTDRDSLRFSVSHVQWDYQRERYHDQENNTLQVTTRDGSTIVFDLSTGLIVSTETTPEEIPNLGRTNISMFSFGALGVIFAVISLIMLKI